jgi:ketosteroid isomerase-like protein
MASKQRRSNVEIMEGAYEAFNAGEIDDVLAVMADDIEWVEPEGDPYGGTYHGPDAVRENIFGRSMEDFEELMVGTERFLDCGDAVVVLGTFRGTVKATGTSITTPFAHVCELEDGRLTRFVNYTDTAIWQQAFEA